MCICVSVCVSACLLVCVCVNVSKLYCFLCYVQAQANEKDRTIEQLNKKIVVLTSQLESTDSTRQFFEENQQKSIEELTVS